VPLRAPRLSPAAWGLLAAATVAAALGAESVGGPQIPERAGDLAAGLALLGGGALAWTRRPRAGTGPLMLLSGLAWFAGDLSSALLYAHRGPLVHLLLAYPAGSSSSRATLLVIAAAYADGLSPDVARSDWTTLALTGAVVLVAAARHRTAAGAERRARAAALAGAALLSATLALAAVGRLADAGTDTAAVWALYGAVVAIAGGLTADLLWGRWGRAALTGFVIDLGDRHEPQALRAALARTLGDPGLELAYRIDDRAGWVDATGRPVQLPAGDGDERREVTLIGDPDAPVAAVVHDPAALSDPGLVTGVAAAARLAVANARLQADVARRVGEVTASRRRLVEAGDEERRRLGEQLDAGPEARLADVAARLERLAAGIGGEDGAALRHLTDEVATTRRQLHEFGQGIRPRTLTDGGLRPALAELGRQASVRVEVDVPDGRFAPAQELVAYFVCSEALANIAKYADASQARIAVTASDGELSIIVGDDGVGGADARRGSGLRGLADRVEALGGRLRVASPPGGGTRVEAVLPATGSAAPRSGTIAP
jgi:signal transduction histidine kinase